MDHPNFGSVRRTSFAKGVITDFLVEQENPFRVASMVKVRVGETETEDYIPLFYRPKEGYWDDDVQGVKATDFDQERGCFKQAWQSFRVGDEVVVLLHENQPQAVLGFYDNVPRLGEDVCRVEYQDEGGDEHFFHIQFSHHPQPGTHVYKGLDEEARGPDGADLGAPGECGCFGQYNYYARRIRTIYVVDLMVPIGPILYLLHLWITKFKTELWEISWHGCDDYYSRYATYLEKVYSGEPFDPRLYGDAIQLPREPITRDIEVLDQGIWCTGNFEPFTIHLENYVTEEQMEGYVRFRALAVKAALFTRERYQAEPSQLVNPEEAEGDDWTNVYADFVLQAQDDFNGDIAELLDKNPKPAELEEAGLWPETQ